MKLLLNTHCTADLDCCQYAFLDLGPELARKILNRFSVFQAILEADKSLTGMDYYDSSVIFVNDLPDQIADSALTSLEGSEDSAWIEIDGNVDDFDAVADRTDCNRMVITLEDIYWTCYPKHADVAVETRSIEYDVIRAVAAAGPMPC